MSHPEIMNPNSYEIQYVLQARAGSALTPPDLSRANGCGEILETLYLVHQQGGADAVAETWQNLRASKPQIDQLFPSSQLIHVSQLHKLPRQEWLIPGMLPARSLAEVHGAPGSGKSLLTLHLAAILSQQLNVVYLAAEGVSGYTNRVAAWETEQNTRMGELYFRTTAINLLKENEVQAFIAAIMPLQPALVVIDTLARCMVGGDENSSEQMGIVVAACTRIIQEVQTTVLLVHHSRKGSSTAERGSSALRGACDAMIELVNDDGLITVSSSKLKDGKPFEPQYFQMKEVAGSVVLSQTDRKASSSQKGLTPSQRKILEAMDLEIFAEAGAKAVQIIKHTEIPEGSINKMLSALKRDGYIRQSVKGDPYFITEAGRKIVNGDAPPSPFHLPS